MSTAVIKRVIKNFLRPVKIKVMEGIGVLKRVKKKVIIMILNLYINLVYKKLPTREQTTDLATIVAEANKLGYNYEYPYQAQYKFKYKMPMIDLSIIVPVYNVEKYLEECIKSLIYQKTSYIYEIILVDDGSKDGSSAICDRYAQLDSRILVIHKKNAGVSCARNDGIYESKGRYITFVDSDDFLEENFISILLDKAVKSNAQMVKCSYYTYQFGKDKMKENRWKGVKSSYTDGLGKDMLKLAYAWGAVYKREVFDNVRFPSRYMFEDMMFAHLVYYPLKTVEYIDIPLYNYRIDNLNSATHTDYSRMIKQLDQVFLAYSTLEFMYVNGIKVDINILKLTIREMGRMAYMRINPKCRYVAFQLGCYTINKLLKNIEADIDLRELTPIEQKYLAAFQGKSFALWKALGMVNI